MNIFALDTILERSVPQQPTDIILNNGGLPDPLDFKRARSVGSLFADGATLDPVAATTVVLNIAGCLLVRLHGKMTGAGTLSYAFRRPPPAAQTAYTLPAIADTVVVANTEFEKEIEPGGEPYLAITWTPGGAAAVTFLDGCYQ